MTDLLWVTDMANPAPRSGGGIRSLRLVQAVAAHWSVDVVNLGAGLDVEAYCAVSGARSARSAGLHAVGRWTAAARALTRRWPLPVARRWDRALAREISDSARRGDVIVIEHGWLLGYLPRQGRSAVVLHNVDSELVQELPGRTTTWDTWAYRRLERRLAGRALVTVVSQRDAALVPGAVVVPNGADVPGSVTTVPREGTVLFIASMGYPPNVAAVEWWARSVWPGSGLPPLTVVGQGAGAALAHLATDPVAAPSLDVIGEVPAVQPWLERARVVVVPVISGSGTRLKVVEAMAHGRPVVSTPKGAEGLGVTSQALLVEDPVEFAQAVRTVLADDALAQRLAVEGRELARTLSWERVGQSFVTALSAAAGEGDPGALPGRP